MVAYWLWGATILIVLIGALSALLFVPQMKGARTLLLQYSVLWVGGVVPILSEATDQLKLFNWTEYVPPTWAPFILLALAIAQIILRHLTDSPKKSLPQAMADVGKSMT